MIFKKIFRGEVFFALFLVAGSFKSGIKLPSFVPDLTLLLMVFSMFVALKRLIVYPFVKKDIVLSFFAFVPLPLFMMFSMLYTESSIYAFEKLSRFISITTWAYIGGTILLKDRKSLNLFLNTLLIVSAILGIQAGFVFLGNTSEFVSVFGSNYLELGRMCSVGIIILVTNHILDKESNKRKKIFAFILVSILMFSLLVSGGRMPLLSLIITLFLLIPIYYIRVHDGVLLVEKSIIKLILAVVFGTVLIVFGIVNGLFSTTLSRLVLLFNGGGDSVLVRLDRYEIALKIWSENVLLGSGIGSFPIHYLGYDSSDYAHNIFLELGSEMGMIGIVSFAFILFYAAFRLQKSIEYKLIPKNTIYCILLITFFLLLNANVSGDLNDNRMLFTFIGIMIVNSRYYQKD